MADIKRYPGIRHFRGAPTRLDFAVDPDTGAATTARPPAHSPRPTTRRGECVGSLTCAGDLS